MGSSSGQGSSYDLSFKITLIGDSGVGKSSLLVSFISSTVDDPATTIGDWKDWMFLNLKDNRYVMEGIPGYLIFAVTLWFIWKWRCSAVFEHEFSIPSCPGLIILRYISSWVAANSVSVINSGFKTCLIAWSPPPTGWVKLNVDGSLNKELNTIAAGGVLRNHRRDWIGGFSLRKGYGSVQEAELWGLFEGLQLAWNSGHRQIYVESDAQIIVNLMRSTSPVNHPLYSLIHSCLNLIRGDWSCSITHVYREGNKVADCLANLGHSLELGVTFFEDPPLQVLGVLNADANGLAVTRTISVSA